MKPMPHFKKSLTALSQLVENDVIDSKDSVQLEPVAAQFQIAITPEMLSSIKAFDYSDPIYAQFVPRVAENTILSEELNDPIGDAIHSPVEGIVHRYQDRVLLKLTVACAVYCRFCFRREMIGSKGAHLSDVQLDGALRYIRNHSEIWEVILTGGDPLILSPRRLKYVFDALNAIPHVKNIRIHTRIPIVDPTRIDAALLTIIQSAFDHQKSVYVVIHANHAQEFTPAAVIALKQIAQAGIPMISQSVLLKNINDTVEELTELMRTFVVNRIKPYYLHQMDLAKGTSHFKVDHESARTLINTLRAQISGICIPVLIQEIPAGQGKTPIF